MIYHPDVKERRHQKEDAPFHNYAEIFLKLGLRKSDLYPQQNVIREVEILPQRLRTGWVTHSIMLTTFFVSS